MTLIYLFLLFFNTLMADQIDLIYKGVNYRFPLIEGTENESAIDIKTLRAQTGLITLDPGFKNTGSCQSEITFLDGEEGILRYRGYAIEDLANNASFIEVAYLLIFGDLPNSEQLDQFEDEIRDYALVDEDFKIILKSFPKSAHPMGILSSLTSALIAFNPSSVDINSEKEFREAIIMLLAKFPVLASWTHRKTVFIFHTQTCYRLVVQVQVTDLQVLVGLSSRFIYRKTMIL